MFKESATKEDMVNYKHKIQKSSGVVKYEYDIIKGMAVSIPEDFIQSFASDPIVSSMEDDRIATIQT
ncbi:hypothetical protein FRC11_010718 [Ceratobasidium sp. 423]|nr:hypothetical protein FRC11_010718 [Ceratobasidium sp. 423]